MKPSIKFKKPPTRNETLEIIIDDIIQARRAAKNGDTDHSVQPLDRCLSYIDSAWRARP